MRVKRIGGRARPSSMASANPRSVSLLALKEGCDGDGGGGVNNHSSESGSIEPQSDGVNVNVTPDSGAERVCNDAEKSHSGIFFGVDGNEHDSGGESRAGVEKPHGKVFEVDGNESDHVNATLDSGGERGCDDAKKLPSGSPDYGGEEVCANTGKPCVMEIDSLEEEICIKCNGGGEVLLCSETGCPMALHEKCLGIEAVFDDAGKFYCPYCLYKRAVARTLELKGKAMEAKKVLSSFLYPKVVGGDKGEGRGKQTNTERSDTSALHGNGNHLDRDNVRDNCIVENRLGKGTDDRQTEGEENIANHDQKHGEVSNHQNHPSHRAARDGDTTCHGQEETVKGIENLRDSLAREKECEDETSTAHQFEVGTVQEEELREHEHGPCVGVGSDRQQAEPSNTCHTNDETTVDNSFNISTRQAMDSVKMSEEIPQRNKGQGTVQAEEFREYEHGPYVGDERQQAEMSMDASLNTSTKQVQDSAKVSENKEQIQPQGQKTVVSSARVKYERRAKQRTQNTGDPYSFYSPSKLATQLKDVAEANGSSQMQNPITYKDSKYYAEKSCKGRMEKDAATKKSRRQQESTRQAPIFFNGKRKRLLWTAEEEEMIKKGVNIMSSTVNKKIPWRKILESGSHVFHPSRNPSDLKDKWKTLRSV